MDDITERCQELSATEEYHQQQWLTKKTIKGYAHHTWAAQLLLTLQTSPAMSYGDMLSVKFEG